MSSIDLNSYKMVVVPGGYVSDEEYIDLQNESYQHWKKIWRRQLIRLNGSFNPDDFFKNTHILSIFHENIVVSQVCCRVVNLKQDYLYDMPYFQDFLGQGVEFMSSKNTKTLMTIEFNAINSKYSERKTGFKFTEANLYLALRLAESMGIDVCTGVPRKITNVQNMIRKMGFISVSDDKKRYDCPVEVMMCFPAERVLPTPEIQKFNDFVWDNQINFYKRRENLNEYRTVL